MNSVDDDLVDYRDQLLRFHPDRFEGRILLRCSEGERIAVKEGADKVTRYLNDALATST